MFPDTSQSWHWQAGFHDEIIRDHRQRSAAIGYVLGNGVKHGCAKEIHEWPWSSLHFPDMVDPLDVW
ncbi:MAG: hypothetical protein PHZ00_01395 [Candidatus Peribacteraceae bacterium]|nr:hypothetical protein [Candidatus Peribacteraceae bacterium]